jgi:hypothetical protein
MILGRFVSTPQASGPPLPEYRLPLLSTELLFQFNASADLLSISVEANEALPLTYTENWLGEPLRILFGQLVYPRLVARIFVEGRAMIAVRPAPRWNRDSDWTALWSGHDANTDKVGFWRLYGDLLAYVAKACDTKGSRNFEANKITQLYVEVIQGSHGSRWVWALTFASSIEGLVKMLAPRGTRRKDANDAGIKSIMEHIGDWTGDDAQLKRVAINAVHRTAETTTKHTLTELVADGAITKFQFDAWEKLRNAVMHGSLVSPYSSEEDDAMLLALADLMKALTRRIVKS